MSKMQHSGISGQKCHILTISCFKHKFSELFLEWTKLQPENRTDRNHFTWQKMCLVNVPTLAGENTIYSDLSPWPGTRLSSDPWPLSLTSCVSKHQHLTSVPSKQWPMTSPQPQDHLNEAQHYCSKVLHASPVGVIEHISNVFPVLSGYGLGFYRTYINVFSQCFCWGWACLVPRWRWRCCCG